MSKSRGLKIRCLRISKRIELNMRKDIQQRLSEP